MGGGKNTWFNPFAHVRNFPRNLGNRVILVLFSIMATCSDSDDEFSSALVLLLHDDVLIKNNNYGCINMQNNGAMKIVNFTHVQMTETRRSFLCQWTSGMRLGYHSAKVWGCRQAKMAFTRQHSWAKTERFVAVLPVHLHKNDENIHAKWRFMNLEIKLETLKMDT